MSNRGQGSASFPPAARVLKAAEFLALRKISRRISVGHFHVEAATNERDTARVGLAVSRRVSKRAVERNRIKRQVRESFRQRRSELPHFDVMVVARSSAVSQDNATLRADLDRLWERLLSLKPSQVSGTIAG